MMTQLKSIMRRVPGARLLFNIAYYAVADLRNGRFRAVFFSSLANILPDLLACGFVRACLWRLAGAGLQDCATTIIRAGVFIEMPTNLVAGRDFQVNRGSYLDATGGLQIGDNVTISMGCKILSMRHAGVRHEHEVLSKTMISDNSIIYAGATVLPGTKIEKFVIVAAGAVLKGETVAGGIYAGVPAKLKGLRTDIELEGVEADATATEIQ
jgi:acetyltransferase-like isoleucine patch superfamily enzyme